MSFAVRRWLLSIGWLFCVLAIAKHSVADETPKPPRVVKLTLSPSAPARPALKHSLVIDPYERTPGNAAQLYYRAILAFKDISGGKKFDDMAIKSNEKWSTGPCTGELRDEIVAWLNQIPKEIREDVRDATRRERCDFEHRRTELSLSRDVRAGGYEQNLRAFARMLRFQARVDLADAKFEEARESLRQLHQLGRDASSDPSIFSAMMGVSMVGFANQEIEYWIGSDGSPNLYWPLSAVPQPYIDVRPALVREVRALEKFMEFLHDSEVKMRSDDEWVRLFRNWAADNNSDFRREDGSNPLESFDALVKLHYAPAKAWLLENGYPVDKLIGMSRGQVVAIHMHRVLREISDEFIKGIYLPETEIDSYYNDLDKRMTKELEPPERLYEIVPVAKLFMPAVHPALTAQTRVELEFAGLRTLEAIRAHMAETGALPEKLEDIKVVPLPANPITHQPLGYERTESGATLTIPALGRVPVKHYELTVRQK